MDEDEIAGVRWGARGVACDVGAWAWAGVRGAMGGGGGEAGLAGGRGGLKMASARVAYKTSNLGGKNGRRFCVDDFLLHRFGVYGKNMQFFQYFAARHILCGRQFQLGRFHVDGGRD